MAIDQGVRSKRETRADAQSVIDLAHKQGLKIVDLKFIDLIGTWQHFSIPVQELTKGLFSEGIGFDGSSIRGFQQIHESDMLLIPDPSTAIVDPVLRVPTLSISCDVIDPITRQPYSRDPRYVGKKAEAFLLSTGIADTSFFGPECEFYIFNSMRFDQNQFSGMYEIDSVEGVWNSGKNSEPNQAYRPRYKEGYFPVPPTDKLQDLRSQIVLKLIEAGVDVEVHHHEVGTAGQTEIDMRFDTLVNMADKVMMYKYVVKNVCAQNGFVATFMPQPLFMDNGSGMHTHQSLWKNGVPLCYDKAGYAGISDMCRWYIGGLLKHAPSLLAFCAPTTNSYRRLVPGYEAPINLVYSKRNRSACVRIPMYSNNPKAKRIEFRSPDPTANPYLAMSALLLAGIDGIKNKLEPPKPLDKDIYELEGAEKDAIQSVPGSLQESLQALKDDHDYLLAGGVFTEDLIDTWIEHKWKREIEPGALRPPPWQFYLYHDA